MNDSGNTLYKFFKVFIVNGLFFGLYMGFIAGLANGKDEGIKVGLFVGTLIGLVNGIIHALATRGITDNTNPRQTRHLQVNMTYDEAFDLCMNSICTFTHLKLRKANKDDGYIEARSGFSLYSYGEIITFQLQRNQDASTNILLRNRPVIRTILLDYGRSYKMIRDILNYMNTQTEVHVVTSK